VGVVGVVVVLLLVMIAAAGCSSSLCCSWHTSRWCSRYWINTAEAAGWVMVVRANHHNQHFPLLLVVVVVTVLMVRQHQVYHLQRQSRLAWVMAVNRAVSLAATARAEAAAAQRPPPTQAPASTTRLARLQGAAAAAAAVVEVLANVKAVQMKAVLASDHHA
jgi:hypothetical protein